MVVMARQPYVGNLETIEKGMDICIIIIFSFEKINKRRPNAILI
jgi:hypothetical protein